MRVQRVTLAKIELPSETQAMWLHNSVYVENFGATKTDTGKAGAAGLIPFAMLRYQKLLATTIDLSDGG